MAFRNSQQARIYVGILGASAYVRTVSSDSSTDVNDTTVLTDTSKTYITGQDTSTFSVREFRPGTAGALRTEQSSLSSPGRASAKRT